MSANPLSPGLHITTDADPLTLRNKHVFILSLSSTIARLLTGITADYLDPPLIRLEPTLGTTNTDSPAEDSSEEDEPHLHTFVRKRPVRLRRSMFAAVCAAVQCVVLCWVAGLVSGEPGLWVLSGGVGSMYGALFTLTVRSPSPDLTGFGAREQCSLQPAMVSAHFGPTNFGLAWGMVSYFGALGSVVFSVRSPLS